jgi:hypothetical protein
MKRIKTFSSFLYERLERADYPSRNFSERTGIKVYRDWNLPGDDDYLQSEMIRLNTINLGNSSVIPEINSYWKEFVDLEPQIQSWVIAGKGPLGEAKQRWDIMFGMISKFNESDIRSFLTRKGRDVSEEDRNRMDEIEKKFKISISWVPSSETLDFIESQM